MDDSGLSQGLVLRTYRVHHLKKQGSLPGDPNKWILVRVVRVFECVSKRMAFAQVCVY